MKIIRIITHGHKIDYPIEFNKPFTKSFDIEDGIIEISYVNDLYVKLDGLTWNGKNSFKVSNKCYFLHADGVYYEIKIEFLELAEIKYYYCLSNEVVINNFKITFKDGFIKSNNEIFLNDQLVSEIKIENNDIIYFREYYIIYTNDFIVTNFKARLPIYSIEYKDIINSFKEVNFKKQYRFVDEIIINDIKLKEPIRKLTSNQNVLILQMGPALTMSFASLSVGCLSLYNALNQGRELIEVLPMLILPITMFISTLIWSPLQRFYDKYHIKKHNHKRLNQYKEYLDTIYYQQLTINQNINTDRKNRYLNIQELKQTIINRDEKLFQKIPKHLDYLKIALGTGDSFNNIKLIKPMIIDDEDEISTLINDYQDKINFMSCSIFELDIKKYHYISIISRTKILFKYILLQLVTYFGYDDLQIVFIINKEDINKYDYFRYVPHATNTNIRFIVSNNMEANEVNRELNKKLDTIVLVLDNDSVDYTIFKDAHFIFFINDIKKINIYSEVIIKNEDYFSSIKINDKKYEIVTDFLEDIDLKKLMLVLFNTHLQENKSNQIIMMKDLYPNLNIKENYEHNHTYDSVKAFIGIHDEEVLTLDLHEKGNGPHILIAGATGSGKSVMMNTMILSLAMNYHPKYLNIIIIDYKGGGLVKAFDNDLYHLPHLQGTITNLDHNEIDRYLIGLNNEIINRQKLFNEMINYTNEPVMNIDLYERLYKDEYHLPFLSHLLIIVDEFAELKKYQPDFMQDLISISRIGRSLGIHLILATQKPSGVVDDQIWSNAKSKICLKVQTAKDSKDMIESDLAYKLSKPGELYLYYDQVLTYALSAISTAPINNNKDMIKVMMIDKMHHILKEERIIIQKSVKEIDYIMKEIINNSLDYHSKPLWLQPLKIETFDNLTYKYQLKLNVNEIIVGEIDDICQCKQYPCLINLNEVHHILVLSLNDLSKLLFICSIIKSISLNKHNKPVLIIDFLHYNFQSFKTNKLYSIIDGHDNKTMIKVFYKLNNILKDTIVIINGYENLCDQYPEQINNIQILMQNYYLNHLSFIILETNSNSVKYQLLQLFEMKFVLGKTNTSELLAIFNKVININNSNEYDGITILDDVVRLKLIKNEYHINNGQCQSLLKKGHNNISMQNNKLIIGQNIETEEFVIHDFNINNILLITSLYDEEIELYKEILKSFNLNIITKKESIINGNNVIVMNINEVNSLNILKINNIRSILWIGEGINNQYVINYQYRKSIDDNEGLYINKGKIVKVELYE